MAEKSPRKRAFFLLVSCVGWASLFKPNNEVGAAVGLEKRSPTYAGKFNNELGVVVGLEKRSPTYAGKFNNELGVVVGLRVFYEAQQQFMCLGNELNKEP